MSRQDHTQFRPAWYEAEMARLQDQKCDCAETWKHPMDIVFAIAFVLLLTAIFIKVFA